MISFGTVSSRRPGKSLGINNIISPKTCSYSCIYCLIGNTTIKTIKRKQFFLSDIIYRDVEKHIKKLSLNNYPDYLTFVSNGESKLDINPGQSIALIKKFGTPVAMFTNSSLLFTKTVRDELQYADYVSIKMDAGDNTIGHEINLPARGLNYDKIINGIMLFASEFKGILCTETMIDKGVNDSSDNFSNLARLIRRINPRKAYLAIPTRPPAVKSLKPPDEEQLNLAWHIFNNKHINTEFLTSFEGIPTGIQAIFMKILST